MGFVHLSRHVRAAPHDVFAAIVDPRRLADWLSLVEEVRWTSPRLDLVDARLSTLLALGPRHVVVDWTVTKATPDRVLHLEGSSSQDGSADLRVECGAWDSETELVLDLEYALPGGLVTSLADRIWIERSIAHDLRHSVQQLAHLVS